MSGGDPEAAAAAWRQVVAWCSERAPTTAAGLHEPAGDAALAAVQDDLGQVWPGDLVAWLRVSDGADRSNTTGLIPWGFIPSPIDRIRHDWRMMTGIARDIGDAADLRAMDAALAGTPAHLFLPTFAPIADDTCGNLLFVDLRAGDLQGCVGRWWHDDGFHGPHYGADFWPSVSQMVQSIADALETDRWVSDASGEHDLEPTVADGVLRWEEADQWETLESDTDGAGPAPGPGPGVLRAEFLLHGGRHRSDSEMAEILGVAPSTIADLREQIESDPSW